MSSYRLGNIYTSSQVHYKYLFKDLYHHFTTPGYNLFFFLSLSLAVQMLNVRANDDNKDEVEGLQKQVQEMEVWKEKVSVFFIFFSTSRQTC